MYQYSSRKIPMMVNAIKNHHPDRSTSCSRLIATANPGRNNAMVFNVSRTAVPPNNTASRIVAATEASTENKVHHQYSDRLDLVLKSIYLRKPEDIAWVKVIYRIYLRFGYLKQ